jgi:hypothetical protein
MHKQKHGGKWDSDEEEGPKVPSWGAAIEESKSKDEHGNKLKVFALEVLFLMDKFDYHE